KEALACEALLFALDASPFAVVRDCIARRAQGPCTPRARLAMLEIVARNGVAADLALLARVADAPVDASEDPESRAGALSVAARRILERDGSGYARLEELIPVQAPDLRAPLLAAAAE